MENFLKSFVIIFVCLNLFLVQVALGKYIWGDTNFSFNFGIAIVFALAIIMIAEYLWK